ncbi:MAG: iron-sulfur cluster-binding protein [Planctomycetota bacterium]
MSTIREKTPALRESRMASVIGRVLFNERVEGGCHRLVASVQGFPRCAPGQFTMLSLDHPNFPILPRPFCLLGAETVAPAETHLEWLIMPVGVGSALLCSLREGEALNVVGPLGCALDSPSVDSPSEAAGGSGRIVCVGGGYGIAPFIYLLEAWRRAGDARHARTTILYGARTAGRLSLAERVLAAAPRVELCTDDGSRGTKARLDVALARELEARPAALVFSCGPERMMEAVGQTCRERGVPSRASLETVMGCGYAVCNGCAVAVNDAGQPDGYTYELACREGTIFDEGRLQWHQS